MRPTRLVTDNRMTRPVFVIKFFAALSIVVSPVDDRFDTDLSNAVDRLKPSGKSIEFAVDFFLRNFKEFDHRKLVSDVCDEYLRRRSMEVDRGIIARRYFLSFRVELRRFEKWFENSMVDEIDTERLEDYLSVGASSLKTWNNRRGYLNSFFRYCERRGYVTRNPVVSLPQYRLRFRRGTAETLSAEKCAELMNFLEDYSGRERTLKRYRGIMVNYFALCLFAGIRPDWESGEIGKLTEKHINFDTGVIHVEPEVSKVNEKRNVRIEKCLADWLQRYPLARFPILPPGFAKMRLDIRKCFEIGYDVLRHTYISMLVGKYRSVGDAAIQAGNSEAVCRRYYLDVKSKGEAERFWSICPK